MAFWAPVLVQGASFLLGLSHSTMMTPDRTVQVSHRTFAVKDPCSVPGWLVLTIDVANGCELYWDVPDFLVDLLLEVKTKLFANSIIIKSYCKTVRRLPGTIEGCADRKSAPRTNRLSICNACLFYRKTLRSDSWNFFHFGGYDFHANRSALVRFILS